MQKDLNISLENIEKSYYHLTDEELNKVAGGYLDEDDSDDDGDDDKTKIVARSKEITQKGNAW